MAEVIICLQMDRETKVVGLLTAFVVSIVAIRALLPNAGRYARRKLQRVSYNNYMALKKQLLLHESTANDPSPSSPYQNQNNATLLDILKRNANTEFGKKHHFADIETVEQFRDEFPIVFYSKFSDEIERLCKGENNLLSSDQVLYFATSSGTTGKQKMIPVSTGSFVALQSLIGSSSGAIYEYLSNSIGYQFTNCDQAGHIMYNPSNHKRTEAGIPYGPISQGSRAMTGKIWVATKVIWGIFNHIPLDITDQVLHFETNLLLQVLFCMITPDLSSINIGFGSMLNHFFVLMRVNFLNLVACIAEGSLYPEEKFQQNIPKEILLTVNEYISKNYSQEYRTERVQTLLDITEFEGVARKLWPKMLYVNTSVSGSFAVYEKNIRYYLGDIPILGAIYMSSEAAMGFQYNELGEYMFHPACAFFEFIPEDEINAQSPKTLLVSELEVGKKYEVVLTTRSGFYRYRVGDVIEVTGNANGRSDVPLFKITYRTGSILDAYGEKTTEKHIEEALQRTAESFGCSINNFTTYLQIDTSPVVYLIFPEFSRKLSEEELSQLNATMDTNLRDIHRFYDQCREQEKLGSVECHPVDDKKFAAFTRILVENGTGALQVKIPHLITKPSYLEFFLS